MTSRRTVRRVRGEEGFALIAVVVLIAVLAFVGVVLIDTVTAEVKRSGSANTGGTALQAAEAGLDDYLAKLAEDKSWYLRNVHPAESTRRPTSGPDVDPSTSCLAPKTLLGVTWTGSASWTYPNGKDNWCQLANGYEYNLRIVPPSPSNRSIQIVSTGRKIGSTRVSEWRALEEWVRFSLITDFQMISNNNYSAGSDAITEGKVYSGGTLNHDGIARANLYSESTISGSVVMQNGALKYDATTIRSQIPSPINFANFQTSLSDIERAADAGGLHLGTSYPVWRIVFGAPAAGQYTVTGCTLVDGPDGDTAGDDPGQTQPSCAGTTTTHTVPANGAIYTDRTAIVSGIVTGRVSIASNDDAIIGGNISYGTGDNVLGIIAKNDVIVAKWLSTTADLSWRAAVIAQNGARRSWDGSGSHSGTATHIGSTATYLSPYMNMFASRLYIYDSILQYLPPPWFPTLGEDYAVDLFREVTP